MLFRKRDLLGHSDIKMTHRYTHLDVSYQRSAVLQLPSFGRAILDSELRHNPHHRDEAKVVGIAKGFVSQQAEMAELADALDSGSSPRKGVEVRVLFSALQLTVKLPH